MNCRPTLRSKFLAVTGRIAEWPSSASTRASTRNRSMTAGDRSPHPTTRKFLHDLVVANAESPGAARCIAPRVFVGCCVVQGAGRADSCEPPTRRQGAAACQAASPGSSQLKRSTANICSCAVVPAPGRTAKKTANGHYTFPTRGAGRPPARTGRSDSGCL
jgi:hypothetical protein